MKTCSKCGESKPLDQFSPARTRKGTLTTKTRCKPCLAADAKEYAERNPEKIKQTRARSWKSWYEKNRERAIAYQKTGKVREAAKERSRNRTPEQRKADYQKNREAILRSAKKNYPKNRDKLLEKNRIYKRENPEYFRAKQREFRARNPDYYINAKAKRRMRERSTQVQPIKVADILKRDGSTCYLCQRTLARHEVTLDHVQPLSRGGAHTPNNIRIACKSCNSRKHNKLLCELEWYHGDDPTALDDLL